MTTPHEEATTLDVLAQAASVDDGETLKPAPRNVDADNDLESMAATVQRAQEESLVKFLQHHSYSEETHWVGQSIVVMFARLDVGDPPQKCLTLLTSDCLILSEKAVGGRTHFKFFYNKMNLLDVDFETYDSLADDRARINFVQTQLIDMSGARERKIPVIFTLSCVQEDADLPGEWPRFMGFSARELYEFDPYFIHSSVDRWNRRLTTVLTNHFKRPEPVK